MWFKNNEEIWGFPLFVIEQAHSLLTPANKETMANVQSKIVNPSNQAPDCRYSQLISEYRDSHESMWDLLRKGNADDCLLFYSACYLGWGMGLFPNFSISVSLDLTYRLSGQEIGFQFAGNEVRSQWRHTPTQSKIWKPICSPEKKCSKGCRGLSVSRSPSARGVSLSFRLVKGGINS